MRDAVIAEAVRAPVGKRNGGLSPVRPVDLSALVLMTRMVYYMRDRGLRYGLAAAAVRPGEDLEQVAVRILEVQATAAVPGVDLLAPGPMPCPRTSGSTASSSIRTGGHRRASPTTIPT